MLRLLKRLFGRKKRGVENCSAEELRHIKQEADHLTSAINSTGGQLTPEELERLRRLTRTLNEAAKR